MKKSTHPLMQLLVMLAIALGMLLVSSILSAPLLLADMSRPKILVVQSATQLLTFLVPVFLMTVIYYRGSMREYYRLDFSGRRWYYALAGVVVTLLLIPANDWLTAWNDSWNLGRVGEMLRSVQESTEGMVAEMMSTDTVAGLMGNLLVVALIPAVCEEVFFRAGFQNLIQKWVKNPHLAIWLTAIIFSICHGEVFAFMPRFVLGALLGYLYVYGGSLLPNMMAHFVNNALVVVLYWLVARGVIDIDPEAPLKVDWMLTTLCTLACAAVLWVTFFHRDNDKGLKALKN
jgi:membrane protease YdiL (CAAX protease family)